MAEFFSGETQPAGGDFTSAPAFGGQLEEFGDFGGGGVVVANPSSPQPQQAAFGWGSEQPVTNSAPEFDGFAAPAQTPTFFSPTDAPAAAAAPLPPLSSGEGFSFDAPTSAHLSGNTSPFSQPESPVAVVATSPSAGASSSNSYLSGGFAAQSPSPYLSGNAPVHETSDFIRQYEEQLERRREEQAHKEAQAKEQAESRAREELARFYEERRKKADASRRAHRESISSIEDRIPDSDASAWASVGRLIDTQSTKKEGRDVSRLKEVLVSMRHN